MNAEIVQKIASPQTTGPTTGGAEETAGTKGAEFRDKLGSTPEAQATPPVDQIQATDKTNAVNLPQQQDLIGHLDNVHKEFEAFLQRSSDIDKLVAEGKLKPNDPKVVQHNREEMRMMLHFQSEMQSAGIKVEIASKVVEHATSGVKTVLSTQA